MVIFVNEMEYASKGKVNEYFPPCALYAHVNSNESVENLYAHLMFRLVSPSNRKVVFLIAPR